MAKGFRSFEIAPPYLYWYYSTPFPVLQTLFLVTMTISFPPQQAYSTNPKPALPSDDGRAGLLGAADGMRRGGSSILVGSGVGVRVVPPEHVLPQFRTHGLHRVLGQQGPLGVKEGTSVLVLRDPLAGEGAVLDVVQHRFHIGLGLLIGQDAAAGDILAILRRVGNGVVHHGHRPC